jgi:MotA/TolQ/ExbB proton channel family
MASTPSQRPTREWPLLVLAVAVVGAICVPLWQWSISANPEDSTLVKWTPQRVARLLLGPEQLACYCCFGWATLILFSRHLEVRRQRRAFGLELLPPDVCILPEDARLLQRRIEQQVGSGGPYVLANLFKLALGKYAVSRSSRDVSETVRLQADLDMSRLVSTMALVNYLAWAIPAIGFLGTVRGLAGSLTLGGETKLAISAFIKEATGHLNVAFDCTLVALALSLVVMFLLHGVQREEECLVLDCQQAALEQLVARLYDTSPESSDAPVPSSASHSPTELATPSRRLV